MDTPNTNLVQVPKLLTLYPKGCSTYGDDAGLRTPVAGMKTLYPSPLDDTAIFLVYCERWRTTSTNC